jgi:hypothetical protein
MNMLSGPISSAISTFAPSMVQMMRHPFIWNFMLPVPLASVPAVEMCWDSSEALFRLGVAGLKGGFGEGGGCVRLCVVL